MRKLKEWKDIIYSKIKEHKKQSITIMLALLIVLAGVGTGMYYVYLPDQASDLPKETETTKGKEETKDTKVPGETKDTAKPAQTEETQKTEEQKGEEEKKETVTETEQTQKTPSSTNVKTPTQRKPSSQPKKQETSKQPSKDTSKQPSKDTPKQPAKDTPKQDSPKQPEKPAHTHSWTAQTKVVQHPATGHNEQVLVKEAWTESIPIYETVAIEVCGNCGADCTSNPAGHIKDHMLNGTGQYGTHTEYIQKQTGTETVNHPAEYTTKWVQDSAAWEETVTTGYKCSCGASK